MRYLLPAIKKKKQAPAGNLKVVLAHSRFKNLSIHLNKILKQVLKTRSFSELSGTKRKNNFLELNFVKSQEMKDLNFRYRGKNKATDVLSFPSQNPTLLGSLVIDVDTARKQAKKYNHSLRREVEELFVHGILHLLGLDHQTESDAKIMRAFEKKLEAYLDRLSNRRKKTVIKKISNTNEYT